MRERMTPEEKARAEAYALGAASNERHVREACAREEVQRRRAELAEAALATALASKGVVMATFEYECAKCRQTFEVEQRLSDAPMTLCTRVALPLANGRHPVACDRCKKIGSLPQDCLLVTNAITCSCGGTFKVDDCGGALRRLIPSSTNFVLKGRGWAKDGY